MSVIFITLLASVLGAIGIIIFPFLPSDDKKV